MSTHGFLCRLAAKLRDNRGFMLAEQLVSVIFIGLLGIMVAAGIGAAMSAYLGITEQTQADHVLSQAVEVVSDELAFATFENESAGVPSSNPPFVSRTTNTLVQLVDGSDSDRGIVLKYAGPTGGATPAPSLIVPASGNLVPKISNVTYTQTSKTWTFTITVDGTAVSGSNTTTMTVKRIGS